MSDNIIKIDFEALQDYLLNSLQSQIDGLSEYDLLMQAKKSSAFPILEGENSVLLFREHFLLMHCLYKLQKQLESAGNYQLRIDPIKTVLQKAAKETDKTLLLKTELREGSSHEALKEYYLNWENFETTKEDDVDKLFDSFWQDYARHISGGEAFSILGLSDTANQKEITARYRELAAKHHPDRGGDKEAFIKIRAAYETLKTK